MDRRGWLLVAVLVAGVIAWLWLGREADEATQTAAAVEAAAREPTPTLGASGDEAAPTRISGHVLDDASGVAIAGAVVFVTSPRGEPSLVGAAGEPGRPVIAKTDRDGAWVIEGVAPGRHAIMASARGYLPAVRRELQVEPAVALEGIELRVAAGGHTVSGVVSDAGGGPIGGVLVRAKRRDALQLATTLTDDEGRYQLTVPDGGYEVRAWHADYVPEADHQVRVRGADRRVDFELYPGASIHGRVVRRGSGEAVAGATVRFSLAARRAGGFSQSMSEEEALATTDDAGRFALRRLPPAEYDIYATASHLGSVADTIVAVGIGDQVSDVVVLVDDAFDVHGRVVDKADPEVGISGALVRAMTMGGADRFVGTSTGPDGTFVLPGLRPDTHMLLVEGEGIVASGLDTSVTVKERDVDDVVVEVERTVRVTGRVDPPTPGTVRIQLRESTGGLEVMLAGIRISEATAAVDDEGRFEISNGATGEFRLVANGDDGSVGETDIVVPAEGLDDAVIEMHPRARIAGTVVDEGGTPMPDIRVLMGREDGTGKVLVMGMGGRARMRPVERAVTDEAGAFEIVGVDPGRYRLFASDRDEIRLLVAGSEDGLAVEVGEAQAVDDVELRVTVPAGRIIGTVVDDGGVGQPDAWVSISPASRTGDGSRGPEVSDADGAFAFEHLPDGEYELTVRSARGDAAAEATGVHPGDTVELVLEAFGAVRGTVTSGGRPVTQLRVRGGRRDRVFASEDGAFAIDHIEPGTTWLVVTADAGSATEKVEIVSGETAEVAIELGGWGGVRGRVVSLADGSPVSGLKVMASTRAGEQDAGRMFAQAFGQTDALETDADGRFEVDGLGQGPGTVRFSWEGIFGGASAVASASFYVEAGRTTDVGDITALEVGAVGKGERGWLGVHLSADAEPPVAEDADAPRDPYARPKGPDAVWVTRIDDKSPAARARLHRGDQVLAIDGTTVAEAGAGTVAQLLAHDRVKVGATHTLTLATEGGSREVRLKAVAPPSNRPNIRFGG